MSDNFWKPDPWMERSDEFFDEIYAGGKCKFCGHTILTFKDVCDCDGMKAARDEFKRKIYAKPTPTIPVQPKKEYKPDAHIEPNSAWDPEPEMPL